MRKNDISFGASMSPSVNIDNRNHKNNKNNKNIDNILILGEGSTQGLDGATLTPKAKYYINFRQPLKRFALSLH